jgi:hypothetical protein
MKDKNFKFIEIMFFFSGIVFYAPVAMLIRTGRGISISEFLILQAIVSFSILFFEIPLGCLTDRIGYKYSMILSSFFILVARFFLLFANSFYVFAFESFLEGIYFAFSSGTISSYLYVIFGEENFAKRSSILQNFSNVGFIVSTVGFFFINKYMNIDYLIIYTIFANITSLIFCFLIPKEKSLEEAEEINKNYILKLLNKNTFKFIIINSILSLSTILINFFYVVIIEKIGLKSENLMFVILAYTFFELLAYKIIEIFNEKNLTRNTFVFSLICGVLFLVIPFLKTYVVLVFMVLLPLMLSVLGTYVEKLENMYVDTIKSNKRASLLSIFSMGANGMDVCFLFVSSNIIDNNFSNLFLFVAILFFLVGGYFAFKNTKKIGLQN